MKSIYSIINNKVYKINQDTTTPTVISKVPETQVLTSIDRQNHTTGISISLNGTNPNSVISNSAAYQSMIETLQNNKVTEIQPIQDRYKLYLDYTILLDGKEVNHSVTIKKLSTVDGVLPLGVDVNNECVFRQSKMFNDTIEILLNYPVHMGLMSLDNTTGDYVVSINDLIVFQDFSAIIDDHESLFNTAYEYGTSTIQSSLENMAAIYSTRNESVNISDVQLEYMPRKILIDVKLLMSNYIVVRDDTAVNAILEVNKTPVEPPVTP